MTTLETEANRFADPDAAYRLLIEAHRGLSDAESAALNARLVLILANQVGDLEVLREALALAAATRTIALAPAPEQSGTITLAPAPEQSATIR